MRDRAARDVAALRDRRLERRRAFDVADGWRVVIESGAPLFPQGFDPLNVLRLSAADVLHSRYVKVGNAAGGVEVIGAASVTEGIGAHPLFNGIRRLTVAGLAAEPSLADSAGTLTIGGAGLTGTLKGARVERGDHLVTIRLP